MTRNERENRFFGEVFRLALLWLAMAAAFAWDGYNDMKQEINQKLERISHAQQIRHDARRIDGDH